MKQKRRKLIGILLALVLAVGLLPAAPEAYALQGMTVNVDFYPSTCEADISWNTVTGTDYYNIVLEVYDPGYSGYRQASGFITTPVKGTSISFGEEIFLQTAPSDDYRFHVWASDEDELMLAEGYSPVFHTGKSTLDKPDVSLSANGLASWSAVSGADHYHLKLYPDHTSTNPIVITAVDAPAVSYDFSGYFIPGNTYHVTIYATSDDPLLRSSEVATSNVVSVPGQKSYITGMTWIGTTLRWDPFPGAKKYPVWLMKFDGSRFYQVEQTTAFEAEYDFSSLLAENGTGEYYVTVVAEANSYNKISEDTDSSILEYTEPAPILTGTILIAGGAKHYGDLLSLEYYGDVAGFYMSDLGFEWQESDNKTTWTSIVGENSPSYQTPSSGSSVIYIRARVTAKGYDGAVYSDMRAVCPKPVTAPFEGSVSIVQDHASEAYFVMGAPITATARNSAGNVMTMDGMSYRWQKRENYDGSPWIYIPGAVSKVYTPTFDDENCFLRAEVSYRQLLGELYSSSKWVDWADETYTVSFDLQGRGSYVPAQTVSRGGHAHEPFAPSDPSYSFGGWFKDPGCTVAYDFDEQVMGDMILYADWTEDGVYVMTGADISAVVERNAGNYIIDDESAQIAWKNGAAPADDSIVECRASSHLFSDATLTIKIHEEPVPGIIYYAQFTIENTIRYDRSVDFSKLTESSLNFVFPGYTVTCRSIDAGIDSMGYSRALLLLAIVKNPPIEVVKISGISVPRAGQHPDYVAAFPPNANYYSADYSSSVYLNDISWRDETEGMGMIPNESVFEAGHQYTVSIYLTARQGYAFSEDAEATLNGNPAESDIFSDQLLVTYTFTVSEEGTPGDVNLDGSVDAADLTALARHVSNISQLTDPDALANADVTGGDGISAADLTKLARFVAHIIDEL
ncbi:MAG: InlB B-repeat-containing protein [Firmicutes bacterium]|nr:InlB B-repeat-containing protein [Bacillota bacterium]